MGESLCKSDGDGGRSTNSKSLGATLEKLDPEFDFCVWKEDVAVLPTLTERSLFFGPTVRSHWQLFRVLRPDVLSSKNAFRVLFGGLGSKAPW